MGWLEGGIGIKSDLNSSNGKSTCFPPDAFSLLSASHHLQSLPSLEALPPPVRGPGGGTMATGDSQSPNMCLMLIILLSVTDLKYNILRVRFPFATLIPKHVVF